MYGLGWYSLGVSVVTIIVNYFLIRLWIITVVSNCAYQFLSDVLNVNMLERPLSLLGRNYFLFSTVGCEIHILNQWVVPVR